MIELMMLIAYLETKRESGIINWNKMRYCYNLDTVAKNYNLYLYFLDDYFQLRVLNNCTDRLIEQHKIVKISDLNKYQAFDDSYWAEIESSQSDL